LQRKHRRKFSSPWVADLQRIWEKCVCNTSYRHERFCEEEDCFSESVFDLFLQSSTTNYKAPLPFAYSLSCNMFWSLSDHHQANTHIRKKRVKLEASPCFYMNCNSYYK
jgi:hypothetical protein